MKILMAVTVILLFCSCSCNAQKRLTVPEMMSGKGIKSASAIAEAENSYLKAEQAGQDIRKARFQLRRAFLEFQTEILYKAASPHGGIVLKGDEKAALNRYLRKIQGMISGKKDRLSGIVRARASGPFLLRMANDYGIDFVRQPPCTALLAQNGIISAYPPKILRASQSARVPALRYRDHEPLRPLSLNCRNPR